MKQDTIVKVRRVRWNSRITVNAAVFACMAIGSVINILKGSGDILFQVFFVLFLLVGGGPSILACLQTVAITAEEIQVRFAGVPIWKIPVSEIETLVYLPEVPYLDRLDGNLLVLSTRTQEHILNHGTAILHSDAYHRAALDRTGRKKEESAIKVRAYFLRRFQFGYMKKEEGVWLSTSMKEIDKIRNALPCATYLTTW